jgi:EF-hand domain pair
MTLPLSLILLLTPATHAGVPPAANAELMLTRMEGADTNRDGRITRTELIAYRSANFGRLDRNKNGVLTPSDMPAFAVRLNPSLDIAALMDQFDSNRDGQVSMREFVYGPSFVFDQADTNHDNILTQAERRAARARLKGQ